MFVRYNHYRIYKEKSYNGSIWIHLFIMGLGIKNTLSQMSEWGGRGDKQIKTAIDETTLKAS
ncbi:MAG: hypothetical protein D3916_18715 [Candidatus Electrothrix sp. MAN1_4]|nr:hypothetical protein [Candidatus Electrothrix sp. MAN1_4]